MQFLTNDVRVVQVTDLSSVWDQMYPLLQAHWKEVAAFQDDIELNVDAARYQDLLDAGLLKLFVCLDGHGLCGYSAYICQPNLHYRDHIFAANDVIFIAPELRGTALAIRLVEHCESELKKCGVSVVTYHMKVYAPFHSLMKATGHTHLEHLYGKKL